MNDIYLKDCCFNNLILKHYTNREFDNFPLELIHLINIMYDYPIPIEYVPCICKYPGKYIITQDLICSQNAGAAIIIASSYVEINFNNFTLSLINPKGIATGVSNHFCDNFTIHSGEIKSIESNNNIGIFISTAKHAEIYSMVFTCIKTGILGF